LILSAPSPYAPGVRIVVFVVLALIPPAFISWMVWQGHKPAPLVAQPSKPAASTSGDADVALLALFDGDLGGAKAKAKPALYDDKSLFEYIDGAAPIFLQRHFRKLGAGELASADGADLVCDIYDMAEAANAESIFNAEKSPAAKTVEGFPEAIAGPMSFVFHASRYYVKLTAFDAKAEAALPGLAKALKEKMR
jgi:hypothetical protein